MEPMSSHPMYIHQLDKMMQMYYKLDEKQLLLVLLLEFEQQVELLLEFVQPLVLQQVFELLPELALEELY